MAPKAVIYARISRDTEGKALGVKRQRLACAELAARRGWEVAAVVVDNDLSAYSGKPRPGYRRLLGLIERDEVDVLLVWHPDRLHRSPKELEGFIDLLARHPIDVATVTAGEHDLTTPDGRQNARITGAVARKESEHKADRLKAKHAQLAKAGKLAGGGPRPFGFAPNRIDHDPAEARLIREAAGRIMAGESLHSIMVDWNARPVPTPGNLDARITRAVNRTPLVRDADDDDDGIPGHGFQFKVDLDAELDAAAALDMSAEDLHTEMAAGKSLATAATEEGLDVASVVDALVADARAKLAQAVTDGKLTQAEADGEVTGRWSVTTLRQVLTSPRLAGLREHGGTYYPAVWEPILDRATWESIDRIIRTRARARTRPVRAYPLTGIIRCGKCGTAMIAQPRRKGVRAYRCTADKGGCGVVSIKAEPVEGRVIDAVLHALDTGTVDAMVAEARSDARTEAAARSAADELAALDVRATELAEMFAAGEVGRKEWQTARDAIAARRVEVESTLAAVEVDPLAPYRGPGELARAWPRLDVDTQRVILREVLESVDIAPATTQGRREVDLGRVSLRWRA